MIKGKIQNVYHKKDLLAPVLLEQKHLIGYN